MATVCGAYRHVSAIATTGRRSRQASSSSVPMASSMMLSQGSVTVVAKPRFWGSHTSLRRTRRFFLATGKGRSTQNASAMLGLFGGKKEPPTAKEGKVFPSGARMAVASVINVVIDIPLVGEIEEQILFVRLVDIVADRLEELLLRQGLPWEKPMIEDVKAARDHEHDDWKERLVSEVNHKLDLPILNEEQEQAAIRFVVDKLFHSIPGVVKVA